MKKTLEMLTLIILVSGFYLGLAWAFIWATDNMLHPYLLG
jgi:hypothetical protein